VVAGVFFILLGLILIALAPRWADNMVKRLRQVNPEVDPKIFKVILGVAGVVAIILGSVEITRALRAP
jgi:uncharacterized membrane protein